MHTFFDDLETRSADERAASQSAQLRDRLAGIDFSHDDWLEKAAKVREIDDLQNLPVLRKSELAVWQKNIAPFGGIKVGDVSHVFQSPGPIYEPGRLEDDWFRMGRFLHAAGIRETDIVQNCFSYHLTPAGHMFESGARAVGAKVLPAGTGQTEMQVQAAWDLTTTAYAGTPDYLKVILEKADEMNIKLDISRAAVGGGALFPSLRQYYIDRGISCLQCYATADLGNIAYESLAMEGMIIDEGVIVEIVTPGTDTRVGPGEVGEVVVTALNPDYALIRFGTGDLSAFMEGQSPCGRTNTRIKGWMGRADQTTKIKGMFVRPEQVAQLVAAHAEITRARVIATRSAEQDAMTVQIESPGGDAQAYAASIVATLKLKGTVEIVAPGSLPNDGLVIEDRRSYD